MRKLTPIIAAIGLSVLAYGAYIVAAVGLIVFAYGAHIPAKAMLAQYLINDAWNETVETGDVKKPWSWADMHPVMKLSSKKHNKNLIVLSGEKGNTLAFAPGYNTRSFEPGQGGTTIISAHRDTHFRFLEDVSLDDVFEVTDRNNNTTSYVVNDIKIIDSDQQDITVYDNQAEIKLITCYPFDAPIAGGPLRYIVTAKLI